MKFDIITIFPDQMNSFIKEGIFRIAQSKGQAEIVVHNLRDWSTNKHKQVDDRPYGGGAGMVLMIEPIFKAINQLKKQNTKVIVTSPGGKPLTQKMLRDFAAVDYESNEEGGVNQQKNNKHFIILCGHYEGFDERIKENLVDYDISIGDYVLSGGELAALVIIDGIVRLLPGVLGNSLSSETESFETGKLDFPVWTRPAEFNGWKVPEILLEGHHKNIDKYRDEQALKLTIKSRSDLLK